MTAQQARYMPLQEVGVDEIRIDTSKIPNEVRDRLAEATMDLILGILRQPGGRESLDAKTVARKAAEQEREGVKQPQK